MADTPASRAMRLYNERQRRSTFVPIDLLSDHAWDLLLWLFVETERGRRVEATDAIAAAGMSPLAAPRWIAALRHSGMIAVRACGGEVEDTLMLSDRGYNELRGYLESL